VLQLLWCCEYYFPISSPPTELGHFCRRRVTSAAIARSLKGALATRADQKGACLLKRSRACLLPNDLSLLSSHISRDCPGAGVDEAAQ